MPSFSLNAWDILPDSMSLLAWGLETCLIVYVDSHLLCELWTSGEVGDKSGTCAVRHVYVTETRLNSGYQDLDDFRCYYTSCILLNFNPGSCWWFHGSPGRVLLQVLNLEISETLCHKSLPVADYNLYLFTLLHSNCEYNSF